MTLNRNSYSDSTSGEGHAIALSPRRHFSVYPVSVIKEVSLRQHKILKIITGQGGGLILLHRYIPRRAPLSGFLLQYRVIHEVLNTIIYKLYIQLYTNISLRTQYPSHFLVPFMLYQEKIKRIIIISLSFSSLSKS